MSRIPPIAKRGEPILQQGAQKVTDLRSSSLQTLIDDMLTTMLESSGVGIAAPQVFQPLRMIIVASHPNVPHMEIAYSYFRSA